MSDSNDNIKRELDKIKNALTYADVHFSKLSESNAALHLSDRVMVSPLASAVYDALGSVAVIEHELKNE